MVVDWAYGMQAQHWNPQGNKIKRWPKPTWYRTLRDEIKKINMSWNETKYLATNKKS